MLIVVRYFLDFQEDRILFIIQSLTLPLCHYAFLRTYIFLFLFGFVKIISFWAKIKVLQIDYKKIKPTINRFYTTLH
jgi:hypothetical protein